MQQGRIGCVVCTLVGCASTLSSLATEKETDRYAPFISATGLTVEGLKVAPKGAERIILILANYPHNILLQSGGAVSHQQPDVVIMAFGDTARAYSPSQSPNDWEQLTMIARNGVKPQSFQRIFSCVEFKAERFGQKLGDCSHDGTQSPEPTHIVVDGPALRTAKRAEARRL